jgi:beta-lactamase regulating signal transducer with metallopeptidase domain
MTVISALNWLGQSAALAAVTAAFVRMPACRSRAAVRHAAWTVTLVLSALLLAAPFLPSASSLFAPSVRLAGPVGPQAGPVPLVVLPAAVAEVFSWFGWAWALGAAAWLAVGARDVWRVLRLKRQTVPLSAREAARYGGAQAAWASSRSSRLAWCEGLDSPAVLGFFGPVIALPRAQVSALTDEQSRLVVLHELAHVRRRDDWRALAERVILALTWVDPVMHWVARELSLSREMACDEWVVRQTASPVAYARCLADAAGSRTRIRRRLRLAAGVVGQAGTLRRRIVGVLALDGGPSARTAAFVAWMTPVAVCVIAAGLLHLRPAFGVANAPVPAIVADAPDANQPAEVGRPGVPVAPASAPGVGRLARPGRRPSGTPSVLAERSVPLESPSPAPVAPEMAAQAAAVDRPPLVSSPLPVASGVTPAVTVPAASPLQPGAARWWSRPAAVGDATGAAAAAVGRTTASFITRAGSRVPQLFTR